MQPEQQENYWQNTDESQLLTPAGMVAPEEAPNPDTQPVSWQASEYIQTEKSMIWILSVIGVAIALLLLAIFLIRSWTFAALVVVMAITLIVIGRRPPRQINYSLTATSLQIAEKSYNLHEFRSFGVVQEGAFYSIRLIPTKRFMPAVSLYFPPDMGEKIVDILALSLPMQRIEPDFVDKILDKIHF